MMTKDELLIQIKSTRAEWDALLAEIDEARMTEPGVAGGWSIKDIVAHVTWFEREMVGVLQARALVGSDLWNLPQDQRNAAVFEQNRNRPLADVLSESRAVSQQLFQSLQSVTDEELNDASHFQDLPKEWTPWQVLAGNTFEHYPEHIKTIREWLANKA